MATKIKDGLFIGDAEASQDPEFMELNKITFVINCAGRQLPNLWEMHGLHYLTFPWSSDPDCILFDGGNVVVEQITSFIDEALEKGDSVLVHSLDGTGRCIACVTAYFMFRHRWGFEKSLDFLCSKRPDAAPIPSFIQQLYHLDLRLCAKWFGPGVEPPEEDRIRHDQWVPLSSSSFLKSAQQHQELHGDCNAPRRQDPASSSSGERKRSGDADKTTNIGHAPPGGGDISLSGISEVQAEELVLVHSFLNSQPQISALPSGRVDYEDHVPKELHWIDRPRLDKLAAVGHLGSDKRKGHLVPVSPVTGRPVPERPANSSYNAMTRETKHSPKKKSAVVGILKRSERSTNVGHSRDDKSRTETQSSECASSGSRMDPSLAGGNATTDPSGGRGREETAEKRPKQSCGSERQDPAERKISDEVVVEDLSETRSDQRSLAPTTDGGEVADNPQREDDDWDEDDAAGLQVQQIDKPYLSLERDSAPRTDDPVATRRNSRLTENPPEAPLRSTQPQHQNSGVRETIGDEHGEKQSSDPGNAHSKAQEEKRATVVGWGLEAVAAAPTMRERVGLRQGDRQAWDGGAGRETNDGGTRTHSRRSCEDRGGEGDAKILQSEEDANEDPRHAPTAPSSSRSLAGTVVPRAQAETKASSKGFGGEGQKPGAKEVEHRDVFHKSGERLGDELNSVGERERDVLKGSVAGISGEGTGKSAKSMARRVSSEGSLTFSSAEVFGHLPQAPEGGRAINQTKSAVPTDPPQGEVLTSEDRRKENASMKRQSRADRESPEDLYLTGSNGASLQQLAQTPNPQQRRLPSPRPQQEFHQGGPFRDSSDAGQIFPHQARPTSAPSQRPEDTEDNNGSTETWAARSTTASSPGAPPHGLMPSGSALQLHDHTDPSRWGSPGGSGLRPQPLQMPVDRTAAGGWNGGRGSGGGASGASGAGGGRRVTPVASSPMSGGSHSSTESLRLARVSSNMSSADVEMRTSGGNPVSRERSGGGGPLPREIRTSRSGTSRSTSGSRSRGSGLMSSPVNNKISTSARSDPTSTPGNWRGLNSSSSSGGVPAYQVQSFVRPTTGTLPRPSRRGSADSGGGGDTDRWANPAPRGRQGPVALGSATSFSYAVANGGDRAAGGGRGDGDRRVSGISRSTRNPPDTYSPSLSYRPQDSQRGGFRSRTGGGAPRYRVGSPAPTRGRKSSTTVAAASDGPASTGFFHQHKKANARHMQGSGIPSTFRGYGTSSKTGVMGGGVSGGGSSRRNPPPSPTVRDRRNDHHGSYDKNIHTQNPSNFRRSHDTPLRQRPSTSEGLPSGRGNEGVGSGRRGRSPSPAPRPSSASGRRRSASLSHATDGLGAPFIRDTHRMGMPIDAGNDRPRWK